MSLKAMVWISLAAALASNCPARAQDTLDVEAARAFSRAEQLCKADGAGLWGVDLCGPVLVADPATRRVVANMDGVETPLEQHGELFHGQLPDAVPIANTATTWNGRSWTMLMTPLPGAETDLSILLAHESWHRVQGQIGLSADHVDADHLATEEGRLALRLELRALSAALTAATPEAETQAVADALSFRSWRQARFPEAAAAEAAMERHEGLAEYTGRVLSQDPEMKAHLVQHLRRGDAVSAYARSFAYYTGPAYGLLLDRHRPGWRQDGEGRRDPAKLLKTTLLLDTPEFAAAGQRYDIDSVRSEEVQKAETQRRQMADLSARLVDGPVLAAPVRGANFTFDPNRVTPLPPHGAVYGLIRAAADWGVLETTKGGLLSSGWDKLSVDARGAQPSQQGMAGDGWTLTLKSGWTLIPGARLGDWTIARRP